MHDALAHVGHRQRHAHARLHQIGQRRIDRVVPFDDKPHNGDRLAQVVGDRRPRRRGAGDRERAAHARRAEATLHGGHATSKRVPHAEFDRVGLLVFVARDQPVQAVGLVELELDDLIVERRVQASREREEGAIGDSLADGQPRGRVESRRVVRIDEGRRELERVDANGLLEDLADFGRERAGQRLRRPGRQDVACVWVGARAARSSGATSVRCTSLRSSARTSAVGSGGSDSIFGELIRAVVPVAPTVTR